MYVLFDNNLAIHELRISSETIGGDGTPVVDNLSVFAIPEPSSNLLTLLGTGLLVIRRRC
ncbi:MAG: hypothetical protein ACI8T1_001540 [Verrucomicrobiales bacterium]|jgi:hypothetical protein